jgi:integrase
VRHQAALPWDRVSACVAALRRLPGMSARALELLVLTATRTGEVLEARWREVDLAAEVWTIPASRTKTSKAHRVPLSAPALSLLRTMRPLAAEPDDCVFPGHMPRRPLSSMALLMLLRRMQGSAPPPRWADAEGRPVTAHGFRATFRTWAGDATATPREIVEAALAHALKDKAEAAYVRTDLLERRRPLMDPWAAHCLGGTAGGPSTAQFQVLRGRRGA